MLKPDGTGWHHRGIYTIAYTGEAYEMVALIMCLTRQTRYAADPWAVRNLADALRTEFILSRGWAMPHGTRGRMLGREPMAPGAAPWYGMGAAFAYLAMADDAVREAMGGLFMRLWDPDRPEHARMLALSLYLNFPCKATVGRRMMLERFAAENLPPAEDPPGLWIKPWGGLAVLRGEQWTLTVKGYSQYVWDFECHPASWAAQEENVFGRYVSHGHAQPMGTYRDDAGPYLGQNLDRGFNFCRFPGTTCKQVPPSMIYDPKTTWQTRWFSDETFLGGVHGPGGVGCFAMKLHDTSFDPSFRATKSWFFFGDTLVCLGSDIACDDASHPVQTTLFQAHLPERDHPMHVNGQAVTDLPWQLESRDALALVDPYDIGYLVPAGQDVTVQRARQAGRDIRNSGDAEGDYATALLDHGPAPGGAGYEYAILMRATPEAAGAFAAEPPPTASSSATPSPTSSSTRAGASSATPSSPPAGRSSTARFSAPTPRSPPPRGSRTRRGSPSASPTPTCACRARPTWAFSPRVTSNNRPGPTPCSFSCAASSAWKTPPRTYRFTSTTTGSACSRSTPATARRASPA